MTDPSTADRLDLADWRRRIADLYAEVRAEAKSDPERAWRLWGETREQLFRAHPQSPVPAGARDAFRAAHWSYDPRYRVEVQVVQEPDAKGTTQTDSDGIVPFGLSEPITGGFTLSLPVSTGGREGFSRIGRLDVPLPGGTRSLGLYWMAGYAGGLFLPFRDGTNGHETYGAGRYLLDTAKSADLGPGATPGSLVLDFNFAFHPSCTFDAKWACPLAPPENRLDVRIEAGERLS